MILSAIIILLTIVYSFIIFYYWRTWKTVPDFHPPGKKIQTNISVIIAARNEEKNIGDLLNSLNRQSYPDSHLEVIVVDDQSTDNTAAMVKKFPLVKLLQAGNESTHAHKKKAIERGIRIARGDLIVTTDADCTGGKEWISTIEQFKQLYDPVFIAAPVRLVYNNSLLQIFQALDFMVLQGITAASVHKGVHSMCNGANLAYEKKAFHDVNGFAGIDSIASGDDMLLMHKIKQRYPGKVYYLKAREAIVTSQPMKTWKDFLNQRIRWASKTFYYRDRSVLPVLMVVYLFNLCFPALLIAGAFNYDYWIGLAGLWLIKTIIELPFVSSVARFYGYSGLIKYLFFFQPLHIAYTILAGLLGQFGKYEWKGRRVR